jgi:2-(1,2-epoxy-1,2-dihydrophenyl)acetyl-CoA isomerase
MSTSILIHKENGVATLTLNRPQVFNSFNREMALALQAALDDCATDEAVRAIVLTGEGKAFCAGQDLAEVSGPVNPGFKAILGEHYNPIVSRIRSIAKPIIALCCDIVVAAESVSFIQAFSKIGLIPDSGGTYFLPRLIGFQKASALMMLGDKVSATEAERMGMLYKVFADDQFKDSLQALALQVAAMPTLGLALTKQALNEAMNNTFRRKIANLCR